MNLKMILQIKEINEKRGANRLPFRMTYKELNKELGRAFTNWYLREV